MNIINRSAISFLLVGSLIALNGLTSPALAQTTNDDISEFLRYLDESCTLGKSESCSVLSEVYLHGRFTPRDEALAAKYANKALGQNAPEVSEAPAISTIDREITVSDRDAQPLVRIPPRMSPRFLSGDFSGFCKVRFDVSLDGRPFNITATLCTAPYLKSPTIGAVQQWKYNPKIVDGQPVTRRGVETTVRYNLQDEFGRELPYPPGF